MQRYTTLLEALRWRVGRRSPPLGLDRSAAARNRPLEVHPGQPEVAELHLARRSQEEVARLDVAVDDARLPVGGMERVRRLPDDLHRGGPLVAPAIAHRVAGGAPLDQLHGQEVQILLATAPVDFDDARMPQRGQEPHLLDEADDVGGVTGEVGAQDLERDAPVRSSVLAVATHWRSSP